MASALPREPLQELAALLRQRRETIADSAWRTRDQAGHLDALREVSLKISGHHDSLKGAIPFQLDHFLTNCSYDKALAMIEAILRKDAPAPEGQP